MWTDNETDLDFLNFTGVADAVAEIVVQAQAPREYFSNEGLTLTSCILSLRNSRTLRFSGNRLREGVWTLMALTEKDGVFDGKAW